MTDNHAANLRGLVSREQAGNAIGKALRLFVGRGRHYSVKQLSNGTGIKDRVIECAMCAPESVDYRPLPLDALLSISKFLGADFTNEWLGLSDQVAVSTGDMDHDDMARACIEFAAKHAQARHPASECGVDIGPREDEELTIQRARLVA